MKDERTRGNTYIAYVGFVNGGGVLRRQRFNLGNVRLYAQKRAARLWLLKARRGTMTGCEGRGRLRAGRSEAAATSVGLPAGFASAPLLKRPPVDVEAGAVSTD